MTAGARIRGARGLVLCQVMVLVSALLAPVSAVAVEPSPSPATSVAPAPGPEGEPSPRAASPTPDASTDLAATPPGQASPTPAPSVDPGSVASPDPSAPASPAADPVAPSEPQASAAPPPSPTPPQVVNGSSSGYIVTFAAGTTPDERSTILATEGADVVDTIAPLRLAVIRVRDGSNVVDALRANSNVLRVERDAVRAAEAVPSDPGYDAQWSLPRIGWDRVYGAVDPTGSSVVAVLDTGVDASHPDLAGQLVAGTSMLAGGDPDVDPNGHGTAMAGIIAAVTDNDRGIAGIGYDGVKVMPVTVLDAGGLGQDSDIIEGVVWAVDHGADVINLSFSNPGFSSALQAAIDYAWEHDVVVVAATGNDGSSSASYPAGDRGVIGVSSTNEADRLDSDSNFGADTFLGAPGEGIRTLAAGGGTVTVSGTSAASAEVAGAAALLRALDPGASNGVIVGRLGRSAADVGSRSETGNGRLDLARAVADDGAASVRPAGVGGSGGPFVGPYVAAKKNLQISIVGGIAPGTVAFSNLVPLDVLAPCVISCIKAVDNDQRGTLTVTPNPGFIFVGWTGAFDSGGTTTCVGTTNPCNFFMSNSAQQLTANFFETSPFPTIDLQASSDTGTSNSDNVTNVATLVFDVTFDVPVTGFLADDLTNLGTATGCVIGAPAGSAAAYTVTVTGCSVGTVTLLLAGGAVTNDVGGVNAPTLGPVVTIDRSGPTVTINQASTQPDPTGSSPILFAVVFSETVPTFDAGDVVITGAAGGTKTVTVTGGGALYLVSVTGMTTNGTVIASITAGATTGLAGNPSSASTSTDNVVTWDTGPPSVTINQAAGQPDPTNVSPIVFTAVFTEPVTGFTSGDVTLTDSRAGLLTAVVTGGPTTYTVTVTGMTTTGSVIASIEPGVAIDANGNPNLGSSSSDNIVLWDVTPPTVTIDQAVLQTDPTNVTPITFTAVFSEPVVGFATGDVTVSGTAGGTKTATVTGGPVVFTVNVTGMTTSGTVTATIPFGVATGGTGNPNVPSTSTDNTVTWNRATHLAFLQQPTDTVYGTSISPAVTVQVLDANGDLVTESSASILLTLAPTGIVLRGIDPIDAVNGIATFPDLTVGQVVGDFTLLAQSPALTDAVSAPFKMLPAPLTITANDRSKPYGTTLALGGTEFTVTGLVPGDSVDSVTLTSLGVFASASVAGSPYAIIPSNEVGTGVANYTVTYVPGELTITAAVADIAVTGYSVPYDGQPRTATGTATGAQGEDLAGLLDLSATTHTAAGSYPVDAWTFHDPAGNYADASGTVADAITPVALTVTANDQSRPYGAPNPALDATISGFVNGETLATSDVTGSPACSTTAVTTSPVGGSPYPITCTAGTLASTNYTFAFAAGELTITSASLVITADSTSKPYGTLVTFAGTEFSVTGLQGADSVDSVTLASAGSPASAGVAGSPYAITASAAVGSGLANYSISYLPGSLTVTPVQLTVTANDQSRPYGAPNPALDATISGFVNGETLATSDVTGSPACSTTAVTTSPVGGSPYPITCSAGTLASTNYTFAFAAGELTITSASLVITADSTSKPYGTLVTFAGTEFSVTGLQGADSVDSVTLASAGSPASAGVAGSPYAITASAAVGSGLANYSISYLPGSLTVTPVQLTVTANDQSRPYGAPNPALDATISGFVNGETLATSDVTGSPACSTTAVTTSPVGGSPYPITCSAGTLASTNYTFAFAAGELTITSASLVITADSTSKPYGTLVTFAGTEFSVTGLQGADSVDSVTLASAGSPASAGVAGSPYAITASAAVGSGLANYSISYLPGSLTVTPVQLTVTANDQSRPYGAPNPALDATISGFVNGETLATSDVTGSPACSTTAVTTSPVGGSPYPITCSAGTLASTNYTFAFAAGELTITSASLVITADSTSKPYGTLVTFAGTEFSTTGLVNGDTVDSVTLTSAGSPASAGVAGSPYAITASAAVGSGLANYAISYVDGELTITAGTLVITADDQAKPYGTLFTFAGTEFSVTGLQGADSVDSVTLASAGSPASAGVAGSPYAITASAAVGSGLANYSISYLPGSLTVTPVQLTVTANDQSRPYGAPNPALDATISGFVNGETLATSDVTGSPACSTTAVTTSPVGGSPYPITCSAGTLASTNYTFAFAAGELTITSASLVITADSTSKPYGTLVTFAGTEFSTTGLVNGDTVDSVTLTSAGSPASAGVAGSPYAITASAAVGSGLANYAISYVDGELTITAGTLVITADDQAKPYGTLFTFAGTEFSVTGLQGADSVDSVTLASAGSPASAGVAGSPYAITASAAVGSGLANYSISYLPGSLTVTAVALTVTANDQSRPYGAPNPALDATISGFVNGETLATSDVTGSPACSTTAVTTSPVGGSPYPITCTAGTLASTNYTFAFAAGELTITAAVADIAVTGYTVPYDGQPHTATGTATGAQGEDLAALLDLTATTHTAAGSYPVDAWTFHDPAGNYADASGTVADVITAVTLTVTANDQSRPYGTPNPALDATISGFVNGETLATSDVTGSPACSTTAVTTSPVSGSPYPITCTAGTLASTNYTFAFAAGELTITAAVADIAVTGYTVPYDGQPHTATGTATGAQGEDLAALLDLTATTHTAAGSYPVDAWTFHDPAGNYADASGTVADVITAVSLVITADDRSKPYGTAVTFAGTEFTVTGLATGDSVDSVTLASAGAAASATVAGSPYAITASAAVGSGLANYTVSYVPGELTITAASLTIMADDQSKSSGVTFTFDGTEFSTSALLNGDAVDSATLTSAGAPAGAAPGTYTILISAAVGTGLSNYAITYISGTMTVGNTTPTVGDAFVTTDATAPVSGTVAVNDPDTGQTLMLSVSTAPANGTATVAQDGSFTYTPTGTFTGRDTFAIQGCDDAPVPACATGNVTVTVLPVAVDDAAVTSAGETIEVDVQANDIGDAGAPTIIAGPAHGTASIGSIIYTPDAGFSGTDEVTYRVCSPNDETVCDDATLTVTVAPPAPPTDAGPMLATPLGPVSRPVGVLVGALALIFVLSFGALVARGRRRSSAG